jgi:hypothetical protein
VQRQIGYHWLGGQFWPGWYWGSAYATFAVDVLGLDIGRDLELRMRAYAATVQSACYWYPTTRFVLVSERPTILETNDDGSYKRTEWRWTDADGKEQTWSP